MSDLFPIPETLSPRLAWMRENRVRTHYQIKFEGMNDGQPDPNMLPWCAWLPSNDDNTIPKDPDLCGYGATEIDALMDLVAVTGVKGWK
jgi:hypothetical protein